jgi:hypothetical protein
MGTYVYALNTFVHEISGFTVGHAQYRYKPSWGFDGDELNTKWYNTLCKRRVTHFENNPSKLPELFFMGEGMSEGQNVYVCSESFICFNDGGKMTVAGHLKKDGRSWTIVLTEEYKNSVEFKLLDVIHKMEKA